MTNVPSACIIGAGSSGIVAAKTLHARGIPFDCFERTDKVGGLWRFENKDKGAAAYRSLHINTSRTRMEYSDYPMPEHYPDFPRHDQIAEYFDAYVDHFGIREKITFNTGVARAERLPDGVWRVTLDTGEVRHYDALLVANGHHSEPRWPEPAFPGADSFQGVQMHAHDFVDANDFAGKNVVVLGMGNSAMDIAVESSWVANRTFLAARRGAYVVPKYIFGKPADTLTNDPRIPWPIRQKLFQAVLRVAVGRPEDYGLPKPDHRFGGAHPTISADALNRIKHGEITPKPNIVELQGDRVRFADGSVEPADVVVYATGYKVTFPFFDEDFISAPDNDLALYRRVFHPEIDNVFFIGLLQPLGAIMPLAEAQSGWIAGYLEGEYAPPTPAGLRADMEQERRKMFRRYVASKRHTMQVDFDDYLYDLSKELAAGAARAREQGHRLPVTPRAHEHAGSTVTA